jgi:hypothetical protein
LTTLSVGRLARASRSALLLTACAGQGSGEDGKVPAEAVDTADTADTAGLMDQDGDGSPEGGDCDDDDPSSYPGAAEQCDGTDNDCDGLIDEGIGGYLDEDGDGYGTAWVDTCQDPGLSVANGEGDCDDSRSDVHPGAVEALCDGIDQDCDGALPEVAGLSMGPAWATIQAALDNAPGGSHIYLCDGTWTEELWLSGERTLTLSSLSADRGAVRLDGESLHSIIHLSPSADLHLEDLTIQNGFGSHRETGDYGGAVIMNDASLHAVRVDFLENDSTDGPGGAIRACASCEERTRDWVEIYLEDCRLEANHAAGSGGAIAAQGFGGSIYVDIEDSQFSFNKTGTDGADLTVGVSTGGGVEEGLTNINIRSSTFEGGTALSHGGSLSLCTWGDCVVTIDNSTFTDSAAGDSGGLIQMGSWGVVDASIRFSTLRGGEAGTDGGLISAATWEEVTLAIESSDLSDGSAGGDGGLVNVGGRGASSTSIRDSDLFNGESTGAGGLVHSTSLDTNTLAVEGSTLHEGEAGSDGGLLSFEGVDPSWMSVSDTTLSVGRSGANGGLISFTAAVLAISNSEFSTGATGSEGSGGLLYAAVSDHMTVSDSSLADGQSNQGGLMATTISHSPASLSIDNTSLSTGNLNGEAGCRGAGLDLHGALGATTLLTLRTVLVEEMEAPEGCPNGAAVYLNGSGITVDAADIDFGEGELANTPSDLRVDNNLGDVWTWTDLGADRDLSCTPGFADCVVSGP